MNAQSSLERLRDADPAASAQPRLTVEQLVTIVHSDDEDPLAGTRIAPQAHHLRRRVILVAAAAAAATLVPVLWPGSQSPIPATNVLAVQVDHDAVTVTIPLNQIVTVAMLQAELDKAHLPAKVVPATAGCAEPGRRRSPRLRRVRRGTGGGWWTSGSPPSSKAERHCSRFGLNAGCVGAADSLGLPPVRIGRLELRPSASQMLPVDSVVRLCRRVRSRRRVRGVQRATHRPIQRVGDAEHLASRRSASRRAPSIRSNTSSADSASDTGRRTPAAQLFQMNDDLIAASPNARSTIRIADPVRPG